MLAMHIILQACSCKDKTEWCRETSSHEINSSESCQK